MPDTESTDEKILDEVTGSSHPSPTAIPQLDTGADINPVASIAKDLSIGEQEVQNNAHASWLMSQNMDDAQRMNMIKAGITKVQGGNTAADQEAQPWYQGLFHNVIQSLPALGDMGVQGGAVGTVGAGVGAGVGSVVPGVGTAAGAAAGWGYGLITGMFKSAYEQSAGEMYSALREGGADHETSKNVAYAVGAVNGALNTLGGKVLTSIAGKAVTQVEKRVILKAATSTFVKQLEKNMFGRMAMNVAVGTAEQTAIGTGTAIMDEAGKVVAGLLQKHNPEAFTDFGSAAKAVKEAFIGSLMSGPVLSTAAHGAGSAAGAAIGKIKTSKLALTAAQLARIGKLSVIEHMQNVQDHIESLPNPWETEETSVEHGEGGEVYIRTKATKTGQLQMRDISENAQSVIDEGLNAIYPEEKTVSQAEADGSKQLRLALKDWRHLNPTEVKGRLNQIASDIKVLRKEEKRLESEITVKEGTGQSSQKLIERWRKVGYAIDALESHRDMLESGLGTTDVESEKNIQLKMRTLNQVFDNLTATAERLERTKAKLTQAQLQLPEIGFKKGAFSKEREIRKIQSGLIEAVNAATQDPVIRANVKQYVNKVTNAKQALTAIENIKAGVLKQETIKADALNEADRLKTFNSVKKIIADKQTKVNGGYPVSRFPAEIVNKLSTLRTFMQDKKALQAYLEQTAQEHGDKSVIDLPEDVADKMQLANMAQALHDGDALTRNVTAATIAQWVYDGKQIIAEKKAKLQAQKDFNIAVAKRSLGVQDRAIKYSKGALDKARENLNTLVAKGLTWNSLWDALSHKDRNHEITKLLDESAVRHRYVGAVRQTELNAVQGIEAHMKAAGFKGRLAQKIWNDNNIEVQITSAGKDGKLQTSKMTRGQMLDVALKAKDESLHPALREGNGFTLPGDSAPGTSTLERIHEAMSKEDHAQLEATIDFYKSYHESINEVYKDKYGMDLPMRDNYSPVTRRGYQVDAPYTKEGLQVYNLLPGSAKTRVESKLPLDFHHPMDDVTRHISQWEYFKHYNNLLDTVGHVLLDPKIRTHLADYGTGTRKVLDDFFERFIQNSPVPSGVGNGLWSAMHADMSNALMGFRSNQFFTILPHGLNVVADLSPGEIVHGVKEMILHPVATNKALEQSPIFAQRSREGTNYDLEKALHQAGLFGHTIGHLTGVTPTLEDQPTMNVLARAMYSAHIGADVGIQRTFGAIVYHAELAKGSTSEQAVIAAERAVEQTQPGRSVGQTPELLTNPIARAFISQYTQHPLQVMGKTNTAIRDWVHTGMTDPKEFMRLGGRLAALWAVPGALSAAARLAPLYVNNQNADEDTTKEVVFGIAGGAVMGPMEGAPIIGDAIQSIWFHAAKPLIGIDESQRGGMTHSNFLSEIYDNTTSALRMWHKLEQQDDPTKLPDLDKEEDEKVKAEISTMKALSPATGIPSQLGVGPVAAAHQAERGDLTGAGFALGGWSPSMLAKRLPLSMEDSMRKEEKRIEDSIKGTQDTNVYDTMKTYLDNLFHGQEPPKSTEEKNPAVEAYLNGTAK